MNCARRSIPCSDSPKYRNGVDVTRRARDGGLHPNSGAYLLELINEVLDISRIEAGHISVLIEPIALKDLEASASSWSRPRPVSAVSRSPQVQLRLPRARRQQRLKQVLLNLLSNAIKYNRTHDGERFRANPRATKSDSRSATPAPAQSGPALAVVHPAVRAFGLPAWAIETGLGAPQGQSSAARGVAIGKSNLPIVSPGPRMCGLERHRDRFLDVISRPNVERREHRESRSGLMPGRCR